MNKCETPKVGDTVRVPVYIFGKFAYFDKFKIESYNYCLGFYRGNPKTPCNFTPLSELYEPGPESEIDYVSNYGQIHTSYIQTFEVIRNETN